VTATVLLRGQGVAVSAAAHLLGQAGIDIALEPGTRRPVPVIMLSDPALALLRDVFGQPRLFADRPRIERRIVRWRSGDPVVMPHGAVVVSEDDLAAALTPAHALPPAGEPSFTIHATAPFPAQDMLRFGERPSSTARVALSPGAPPATCWIESANDGWLFLIPDGTGGAWLLAVGDAPDALLAQAPMIAPLIAAIAPAGHRFDTSPRMLEQLAGDTWLACGTAALAFDPICGDGTAQATREAILASAVVTAMARGEDPAALCNHYHAMLLAALRRHLQLSLPFYAGGGTSPWWQNQFATARAGYDTTTALLGHQPEPRFALSGFDLIRRERAA
jgi:2-polyprenyl-6-methoxyphenol hydroxylase-like FAD-dependent oxidoreductase